VFDRTYRVPDILFTTIEPPADLPIVGKGCFIQARICRPKKESRSEANAKEISDVRLTYLLTYWTFFDDFVYCIKSKGSPYLISEHRVPELIQVLGSQPAADVSHKPGGRLPLLSTRPAVTPQPLRGLLPILLPGEQRHNGM